MLDEDWMFGLAPSKTPTAVRAPSYITPPNIDGYGTAERERSTLHGGERH